MKSYDTRKFKKTYKAIFKEIDEAGVDHLVIDLRGNGGGYFPNGNYFLRYLMREKFSYHFYESDRKKSKDVLQPKIKNSLKTRCLIFRSILSLCNTLNIDCDAFVPSFAFK